MSRNQWVSYDDETTFAIKLNYANERCLGGTMIWSVDQDDSFDYSARAFLPSLLQSSSTSPRLLHSTVKALYPTVEDVNSGTHQGGDTCFVAGPNAPSCGPDFGIVETATDADGNKHPVCCPNGDLPTTCHCRRPSSFCICIPRSLTAML